MIEWLALSDDLNELNERINKMNSRIGMFTGSLRGVDHYLMEEQVRAMKEYARVLRLRIERLKVIGL
jgi:hypothetical protein